MGYPYLPVSGVPVAGVVHPRRRGHVVGGGTALAAPAAALVNAERALAIEPAPDYLFAAAIGFATTVAEPALIAVSIKANQVSGGTITVNGLRFAVALGVAIGVSMGTFRIVTGTPLHWYIITGYVVVIIQTAFAPRAMETAMALAAYSKPRSSSAMSG